MDQKTSFEELLNEHRIAVERYVNFRLPNSFDADDVIQETYYAAYIGYEKLRNKELFKPWILSIAKNQCNLWLRKKYKNESISFEVVFDIASDDKQDDNTALYILNLLPKESAELLLLTMQGYRQSEIAKQLAIPLGTVKSRLHYARKQFRSMCTPEQLTIFEKGRKAMPKKDYTCGFPKTIPTMIIEKSTRPFIPIKCAEENFIIPIIGNKTSEGTYRYPEKKLALVSTCYVPKGAMIHDAVGVKVCRDTYNLSHKKLYKNEAVWFSQMTDEYIRTLGSVCCDQEGEDDEWMTEIHTFLEEDYDVIVNGNDRIHGRPLLIKENPPKITDGKIYIDAYNIRYTMGSFDIIIGERKFETIMFINPQTNGVLCENYVDTNGRLVLMRWYESMESIEQTEYYDDEFRSDIANNPSLTVNNMRYLLIEDRISEYAL